jgi:hypothetical protein
LHIADEIKVSPYPLPVIHAFPRGLPPDAADRDSLMCHSKWQSSPAVIQALGRFWERGNFALR